MRIFNFLLVLIIIGCQKPPEKVALDSWNDGENKQRILEFVQKVTLPGTDDFVPVDQRIAVFDNDGTLWCEKPLYPHFFSLFYQVEKRIEEEPALKSQEPFKSLHAFIKSKDKHDLAYFMGLLQEGEFNSIVGQLMGSAYEGMSPQEFEKSLEDFYASWKHPRFDTGLQGLTYLPMKELIDLLHENEFKVYIFTADEGAFLKLYSQELYGIPPERVHGTDILMDYNEGELIRTDQGQYLNNWDGKARKIYQIIGKQPILSAGNSNGDFDMLQYANTNNPNTHLEIMVYHTDDIREYSYDSHTDNILPYGLENDYLILDMKRDWAKIFSAETK
jgi:phosphoglycolate phosphatase-like HAD superfamily hydrolase